MRRFFFVAAIALALFTACVAVPPPAAPAQARCPADLGSSPFAKPGDTKVLVADFSTRDAGETDVAERFVREVATELRRLDQEALAPPPQRRAGPAGAGLEIERLHCVIDDHEQAHAIAEALGADYVVWGGACETAGEQRSDGALLACPRVTVHRHYAEVRRILDTGADILASVNMELPPLRPEDPLPLVHFALGMHFHQRAEGSLGADDWRLSARFFRWSGDGVAAGAPHREMIDVLTGRALFHTGDTGGAIERCDRGHARGSAATADVEGMLLLCVADALRERGDLPGAMQHYQRAMELAEKARDDAVASVALGGVGAVLLARGDTAAAVEQLRKALVLSIRATGGDSRDTGMVETALADAIEVEGDVAGALEHYRRALAIETKALGEESFVVGLLFFHVGHMLHVQGDTAGAVEHYERALVVFRLLGTTAERQVAMARTYLGAALRARHEFGPAVRSFEEALSLLRELLGPSDLEVAAVEMQLSGTLLDKGDYGQALEHARRALAIVETLHGSSAEQLVEPLNAVASAYTLLGDLHKAEEHLRRAIEIAEHTLGPGHVETARLHTGLGVAYLKLGRYGAAAEMCGSALHVLEAQLGSDHPDARNALACVAAVAGRRSGWTNGRGAVVVRRDAETAPDLETGDWLVAFDGKPFEDLAHLVALRDAAPRGRLVKLSVVRRGKRIVVPAEANATRGLLLLF
jgi:tetratricopeptide (TPR) repeat protein